MLSIHGYIGLGWKEDEGMDWIEDYLMQKLNHDKFDQE